MMKITYDLAKSNPAFRQIYLDSLFTMYPESMKKVIYDPDKIFLFRHIDNLAISGYMSNSDSETAKSEYLNECEGYATYFSAHSAVEKYGCEEPQIVYSFPPAFNNTHSENEFLSILIDHESIHTNNAMYGITLSDGTSINKDSATKYAGICLLALDEFLAYRNQWLNLNARGVVRPDIVDNVKAMLSRYQREADEFFCIDDLLIKL